jgi:dTMP kinase
MQKAMSKGKFIVIEGMEGAGKSSAIAIVESILQKHNINFINTREPGGTPLAESLRSIVKSSEHNETLTEETELFLMYASRSQLLTNKILPAVDQGIWVLGDRHNMSSLAYQGGGRQFCEMTMKTISDMTLKGFNPDITLYLDVEPKIGLARAKARGKLDRIELEKIDFFQRVHNQYKKIANSDSSVITIDAANAMTKVHSDITNVIEQFIINTRLNN